MGYIIYVRFDLTISQYGVFMKKYIQSMSWFSKLIFIFIFPLLASMASWIIPVYIGEEVLEVLPHCLGNRDEYQIHMYAIIGLSCLLYLRLLSRASDYSRICETE